MRVIFHLGLHKTATTYLQKQVFPLLNTYGNIAYNPDSVYQQVHKFLYKEFMTEEEKTSLIDHIKLSVKALKCDTLFLSDENFSQTIFYLNYDENVQLVKKIFPTVHFVVFLRNPSEWVYSCYKQSLQMGDWQPFKDFVGYDAGKFIDSPEVYHKGMLYMNVYRVNFMRLFRYFNRKNSTIVFYESFKKNPKLVLQKLFADLELPTDGIKDIDTTVRVNASADDSTMYYLLWVNKIFKYLFLSFLLMYYRERRKTHYQLYLGNESVIQKKKVKIRRRCKFFMRRIIFGIIKRLKRREVRNKENRVLVQKLQKFFLPENQALRKHLADEFDLKLPQSYTTE